MWRQIQFYIIGAPKCFYTSKNNTKNTLEKCKNKFPVKYTYSLFINLRSF